MSEWRSIVWASTLVPVLFIVLLTCWIPFVNNWVMDKYLQWEDWSIR